NCFQLTVKSRNDQLRQTIFKLLYYKGALSVMELSKLTKKSIPNVTNIINGLIKDGFVIGQGLAPSTGGRRAARYRLNKKKKKYIVVVAMDQFVTRIVLYNLLNEVIHPEAAIALRLHDNASAFEELCDFIRQYIDGSRIASRHILGIGVGMPGFVDVEKGVNASF